MAKQIQKKVILKPEKAEKPPLIPEKYQDPVFIGILIIAIFVFFSSAIFGGGFKEFDNLASYSFRNFLNEAKKEGIFPLWMPYIFSGMPSYASLLVGAERLWDFVPLVFHQVTGIIGSIFNNDAARVASWYAIYAVGMYLLMKSKLKDRHIALFVALAAVFSTWVVSWIMIGHNTKPIVFAMFPFIFLFMEKLREKFSILYAALLLIFVHMMNEGGHLQMMFYGICAFGIYVLVELINRLIYKQQALTVLRAAGLLAIAGGFAFLMSADRYLSTFEYTPYSTRGSAPITKTKNQHQDASGGHDYEYATMWSYSPEEVMTFFVPSYFGYGVREFKENGKMSTYWGQKESEDSPPYMGIGILMLAILGMIMFRKEVFVQFLIALTLFGLILSFGKNLSVLYDLFYNNIPSFNKFRAPSMSLALIHFAIPVLAGYGVEGILSWRKDLNKKNKKMMMISLIVSASFIVIGFLFSAAFKTSYMSSLEHSNMMEQLTKSYGASVTGEFSDFIWSNMIEDWYINGLILLAMAASFYFFVNRKINKTFLFTIISILLIVDLWRIDFQRMDVSKEKAETEAFQKMEDIYGFIKQDKGLFRVADFASSPANIPAYFQVENINGYHAAKLRIYQDLLDAGVPDEYAGSTSQLFSPFLWNLLNVKYIVTSRPLYKGIQPAFQSNTAQALVYANPMMLERTFFVKHTATAKQIDILNHLKKGDFNPTDTAFVEKDLNQPVEPADSSAISKVTDHRSEYIRIEANASGNNLLFISEIYYPAGWTAYIDGKETDIIKTNFAFRSVIVPKGKHVIEMKFRSKSFEQGKTYSIVSNLFLLAVLAAGIFFEMRKKKK